MQTLTTPSKPLSIRKLKEAQSSRFPTSKLTEVLRRLPDEIPEVDLPACLENWFAILDAEAER